MLNDLVGDQLVHLKSLAAISAFKSKSPACSVSKAARDFKELLTVGWARTAEKGRRASHRRPSLAAAGSGAAVRFRCTSLRRACYHMINDCLTKSGEVEAFPGRGRDRMSYPGRQLRTNRGASSVILWTHAVVGATSLFPSHPILAIIGGLRATSQSTLYRIGINRFDQSRSARAHNGRVEMSRTVLLD